MVRYSTCKRIGVYIAFFLLFFLSVDIHAKKRVPGDNYRDILTFSPYIGLHRFSPQKGFSHDTHLGAMEMGLRGGFFFDRTHQLEGRVGYISSETYPGKERQQLMVLGFDLISYMGEGQSGVQPYFIGEIGSLWNQNTGKVHMGVDIGLGVVLKFPWVPIRAEIKETFYLRDGTDTVITIGPHFRFDGHRKDMDRDGIPDYRDVEVRSIKGATVNSRGQITEVQLHIQFKTDQTVVRESYMPKLKQVSQYLKANKNVTMVVNGHTDNMGSAAYNRYLSEQRAKAVKRVLVRRGISSGRISTTGYGESVPISTNDTVAGRYENRRVQLRFFR
ncbi:MAG: OmpA family protein [Candidatus Margulisbacteria bacterium]|nr:OmpA family protein [Candidatus Margulisiibacteriota bacterium]